MATLKKGKSKFVIKAADVSTYTSWTDGTLSFRDEPSAKVLKRLGKWYNISIDVVDPQVSAYPFTATIKNEDIDQIIDLLQYSTPFNIQNKRGRLNLL